MADFTSYERNYPFTEKIEYNVLVSQFENWSEQRRVKCANPRRMFVITFYPKTLTEATAIKNFFIAREGAYDSFTFTNPMDSTEYTVRFMENSFAMERTAYNTVRMQVTLIEVL
jgi:phage-related protein